MAMSFIDDNFDRVFSEYKYLWNTKKYFCKNYKMRENDSLLSSVS